MMTQWEIVENSRIAAKIIANLFSNLNNFLKPGLLDSDIDIFCKEFILNNNGEIFYSEITPVCLGINNVICHNYKRGDILKSGDIITVDCVVSYKGCYADSAYTYLIGDVSEDVKKLTTATYEALWSAISFVKAGNKVGDIGYATQTKLLEYGFEPITKYSGHTIGTEVHQKPWIRFRGNKGEGEELFEGQMIAIEPIVNLGSPDVVIKEDESAVTPDGKPSAHFEHTVLVLKDGCEVLTFSDNDIKNQKNNRLFL